MNYRLYRGNITRKWAMHVAVEAVATPITHVEPDWISLGTSNASDAETAFNTAKALCAKAMNKGLKPALYTTDDIRTEAEGREGGIE